MGASGAWGRFRAHLSAASTRRFHQISFPGEVAMVRPTGIEPMSARRCAARLRHDGDARLYIELRTLISRNGRSQSRTRTCEAHRHLIYSQASLPLEYLCGVGRGGRTCTCVLRVMSPVSCCCSTPRRWCERICDSSARYWRKADGSNATPYGAHPFSGRVAGHSSGTFRDGDLDAL